MTTNDWSDNGQEDFQHPNQGYVRFCSALDEGRLSAGMTLTQNELSEILGMSLSPLRESLVLLEEYGLVEIKPRAGIRIFYPDVSFIRENMQYRSMIELFALPVFIRNASGEWLKEMRSRHMELQTMWNSSPRTQDPSTEAKSRFLDKIFHNGIVSSLGNPAIQATHKRIIQNVHIARTVHQTSFGKGHYLDTIDEHMSFLDAVEAGDSETASSTLEGHFRSSTHRLFIAP